MSWKKKIVACLLLIGTLVGLASLSGCSKRKGTLIASIGDEKIYSNDEEFTNRLTYYLFSNNITVPEDASSSEEYVSAYMTVLGDLATAHVYEKELKSRGIEIDEQKVKEQEQSMIDRVDSTFDGGYTAYCNTIGITQNFFHTLAYFYAMQDEISVILEDSVVVTDNEIEDYYLLQKETYSHAAGYLYDTILVEVLDLHDEAELTAKKEEAEGYLARLKKGEDFSALQTEIKAKYDPDVYFFTTFASGEATLTPENYTPIADLNAAIAALDAQYEKDGITYDASAETGTDAFNAYQKYINAVYRLTVQYALGTATKAGELYDDILFCPFGYVILKNITYNAEKTYTPVSELYDEIKATLTSQKVDNLKTSFVDELFEKYEVVYYSYSE